MKFSYAEQPSPDGLARPSTSPATRASSRASLRLVLGDNLFYGAEFVHSLAEASARTTGSPSSATMSPIPRTMASSSSPRTAACSPRGKTEAAQVNYAVPASISTTPSRQAGQSLKPSRGRTRDHRLNRCISIRASCT